MNNKGKNFLSDLKFFTDYSKWNEKAGRYETWDEACDAVVETHRIKYKDKDVSSYIDEALEAYKDKLVLASQRNLQFRGDQIFKHNTRLYNCATAYMDKTEVFSQISYLSLSGCGAGINMMKKWTDKLPNLKKRDNDKVKNYIIEDSIEGWSYAFGVLASSFCDGDSHFPEYEGCVIRFDYSKIRPKGAMISGGFKAPGPEPLKKSIEKIETLLNSYVATGETRFKSIIAYDILMFIADSVLSAGLRRSALSIIVDPTDTEMINAKVGDWRTHNKQRERSNNSVGLIRGQFTYEDFNNLVKLNNGMSDIGFVFLNNEFEVFNPCFEIEMTPILDFETEETGIELCNLTEINAKACRTNGSFDEKKFLKACRAATILGTLQAGYTDFPYLGKTTEEIVKKEALIGVSITGWMNSPELFDEEILGRGVDVVKQVNEEVAKIIGINPAARLTTTKPSGNASVILGCASGIHPEHSRSYFRIMQLNKMSETAKWMEENNPEMIEDSLWSANDSDYVVYCPVENEEDTIYKEDMKGIDHLEKIRCAQNYWITKGRIKERGILPDTNNNVSCTVIIDDYDEISKYVFDHQDEFTAVSFLSDFGDKDYPQAPFTSVYNSEELLKKYGDGVMFASGLIVDGLHYFNDNLWDACDHILNKDKQFDGTRAEVLLKKDWVRRAKQFSKNYFKSDLQKTIYCLKDVHLWHKWNTITKSFKDVKFEEILSKPVYNDVDKYGAVACSGGSCEIV